ncbi:MAG: MBL fold metallo-hydrolase [Candidatus Kapaibacterium sp.]
MGTLHQLLLRLVILLLLCSTLPFAVQGGDPSASEVQLVVLGTLQDGGSPHAGCRRSCCRELFAAPPPDRKVVSLGVIDRTTKTTVMFEASPDMPAQMKMLRNMSGDSAREVPDAVFITHAHIGHYTGLMYLGKEAMDAKSVNVYAMPRLKSYLETNGPWSQLVRRSNIALQELQDGRPVQIGALQVTPRVVPHRDEYSETVGYRIRGPRKTALFIPDIDKWEKWKVDIVQEVRSSDYVLIDATFYDAQELPGRAMEEIPHPFVVESMKLFDILPAADRAKVIFIHLNHTNPALMPDSEASKEIRRRGYGVARLGDVLGL